MKRKNTKKALSGSVLALVLCFVMLIGTTFAWFTSSDSTAVNTIEAGTLKVGLEMWNGSSWVDASGKTLDFNWAETNQEGKEILWEPGATYTLPKVRVVNNGNLALKYKVVFTAVKGDSKLAEVLNVSVATKDKGENEETKSGFTLKDVLGADYDTYMTGNLTAGQAEEITISMTMDTKAGNAYQGLKIDGIAVTVVAAQDTVEYDSTRNDYDAQAIFPEVATQEELTDKLSGTGDVNVALSAGTYTLPVTKNKSVTISGTKDTVIDMTDSSSTMIGNQNGGLDITFDGVTVKFVDVFNNYEGITHSSKVTYKDCVLLGTQTLYADDVTFINCTFKNSNDYAIWTWGARNVTFEGCTFYSGGKAILLYGGAGMSGTPTTTLNVNDCTFYDDGTLTTSKAAISTGNDYDATYVLNASNNTVYGFAVETEGMSTNSKMYGNKNSMDAEHLLVTLSNNTVYDYTAVVEP